MRRTTVIVMIDEVFDVLDHLRAEGSDTFVGLLKTPQSPDTLFFPGRAPQTTVVPGSQAGLDGFHGAVQRAPLAITAGPLRADDNDADVSAVSPGPGSGAER